VKSSAPACTIPLGPFTARLAPAYDSAALRDWLSTLPARLATPEAATLSTGRNHVWRLTAALPDGDLALVVKRFGGRRGVAKARRTWINATFLDCADGPTPAPVACIEERDGPRPRAAYFLALLLSDTESLAETLSRLYEGEPYTESFMGLMQAVAPVIRHMHDAGFIHHDLGNQNILLRRTGPATWDRVNVIDLNRGRICPPLSLGQRGRDLSRLALPSDFMRVFIHIYWGDTPPPPALFEAERRSRAFYRLHHRTRKWRHPLREVCRRRAGTTAGHRYPDPRDIWVWDDRSGQALTVMRSTERRKHYPPGRHLTAARATLRALPPVWSTYRRLLRTAYGTPVDMRDRIGMSLEPSPARWPHEKPLLTALSSRPLPVLIRFYHHAGDADAAFRADVVRELHAAGHPVAIALVQDRRAVREPRAWERFITGVLAATAPCIQTVEVTHAMNRVKWGIWDFRDFRRLMEPVAALAQTYPALDFIGPAVIDFEYMYVLGALDALPPNLKLAALSHLLYVDRRGPPEARQGAFATLEKAALARAVAAWSPRCDDRLIVSEVNWPLAGTGVYSPVGAPYVTPGIRTNDPSVDEQTYAAYMIRYLLITLCSGLVERVYWWRLAARGFGLVDDRPEQGPWRERPAYAALRTLLGRVGEAQFIERTEWPSEAPAFPACGYWFQQPDGKSRCIAWAPVGGASLPAIPGAGVQDMLGRTLTHAESATQWPLDGQPLIIACP